MEQNSMKLKDLTEKYREYMKLESEVVGLGNQAEHKRKLGELEDEISYAYIRGGSDFVDTQGFLSMIRDGVESNTLGRDLYTFIGRDVYAVLTNARYYAAPELKDVMDKSADGVFSALAKRLGKADSEEVASIYHVYDTMLTKEVNKGSRFEVLTEKRTEEFVQSVLNRNDEVLSLRLSHFMRHGNVSEETLLAYVKNPTCLSDYALSLCKDYLKHSDINAEKMPDTYRKVLLEKLEREDKDKNGFPNSFSKDEVRAFIRSLPIEDFKNLDKNHWLVRANSERYEKANKLDSYDMGRMLVGNNRAEGEGRLGQLDKWFEAKTKAARLASKREQRPLTSAEEKDLVLAAYVYMTLNNYAVHEVLKKGKVSDINPDGYMEKVLGILDRSKDSGLAPRKNAKGEMDMQISFERELNGFIPQEKTVLVDKETEVKAKGLLGMLGKKETKIEQVEIVRALTDDERRTEKGKLDAEFAALTETAFYEKLALRVNQLQEDTKFGNIFFGKEFDNQNDMLNKVADRVNSTQIVQNASSNIKQAIATAHEHTLHDTKVVRNGKEETVRYCGADKENAAYYVSQKDVNGGVISVPTRRNNLKNQPRDMAMAAMREMRGR